MRIGLSEEQRDKTNMCKHKTAEEWNDKFTPVHGNSLKVNKWEQQFYHCTIIIIIIYCGIK